MNFINRIVLAIGWGVVVMSVIATVSILVMISVWMSSIKGEEEDLDVVSENGVAVVELTGEILSSKKFIESLNSVVDSKKFKAAVVRIDTPGGMVGASEEIFSAIKAANAKKPVVCSMGNIAASGGLMASLGCKKIVANAGTLTGSIGVIMMMPNFSSVMKNWGVDMTVIKSGEYKDSGSPFRPVSAGDKELLQKLINKSYDQFVKLIAESRGLEISKVKSFADGRVILGEQALTLGLIDALGDLSTAAKLALEIAGISEEPEIIYYRKKPSAWSWLKEIQESEAAATVRTLTQARVLYKAVF